MLPFAPLVEEFIDIAAADDVPPGRSRSFLVGDRKIALFHTASGFHASENSCPHRGGPLAEGDLIGEEIICPWHLWGFDVRTGICTGNAEVSLLKHEVRVSGGRIFVRVAPRPVAEEIP